MFINGLFATGLYKSALFYLGPESIMPLASILAAVIGFILIFWRSIIKIIKKVFGKSKPADMVLPFVEPEDDDLDKPGDV